MAAPTWGLNKKPPVYSDPCMAWIMSLSKAALADCVCDLLRGISDHCDDPVPEATAIERLLPVLGLRNDKAPEATSADA